MVGDPTVDTLGEPGKYQYLVDYWVEPRVYAEAPPTGWGPKFEEEDKAALEQKKQGDFIGMIGANQGLNISRNDNRQGAEFAVPKPKSYVFHKPITPSNYKAAPFNYQAVHEASMTMVRGLTRTGRVYELNKKEVSEGIHQQSESGKIGGDEALHQINEGQ